MPKEVCQSRSHVKVMLSVFFNTEGIVNSEFFSKIKLLILHFTKNSWNFWEWPYKGKNLKDAGMAGYSITTMHPATHQSPSTSYWRVKTFPNYKYPNLLTYYCVASGCSSNSKKQWKQSHMTQLKTSFPMWHTIHRWLQKKTSRDISNTAGAPEQACVCVHAHALKRNNEIGMQSFNKLSKSCLVNAETVSR
jgi:hypothetical protein